MALIHKVYGNVSGLKAGQMRRLQRLYQRKIPAQQIVPTEFARQVTRLSRELRRQIGVLVHRRGKVHSVVVGDHHRIWLPELPARRAGEGRLRGLRYIHTFLNGEGIAQDDVADLVRLKFDLILALESTSEGEPGSACVAHIAVDSGPDRSVITRPDPVPWHQLRLDPEALARDIETALASSAVRHGRSTDQKRSLLVDVDTGVLRNNAERVDEMRALAHTMGYSIKHCLRFRRKHPHPKFLLGPGQLQEVMIQALRVDADTLLFVQDLLPGQYSALEDLTRLGVVDRTQLILDIFAKHAVSRAGKLQIELARLKYMAPRLAAKHTAMSRLTGGIGTRGPGETKLEEGRRHVRRRIKKLESEIDTLTQKRGLLRRRRCRNGVPVVSIVGYTNAGKSSLLNTLTGSTVKVENRLFATLDPSSKRLRFPRERDIIVTDTVGFIRDLPPDLLAAFRATLEELEDADLMLHVIDLSNEHFHSQMEVVDDLLGRLGYRHIPRLTVFNKIDRVYAERAAEVCRRMQGIGVSALDPASLTPLLKAIEEQLYTEELTCRQQARGFHIGESSLPTG